jgi:GrpB-like predicted nucleotidyltransferase (UPF0157 family)
MPDIMAKPDLRTRLKRSLVANDTTPFGDHCRKRDALRAVRERYWSLRNKLAARMEREIARIEREM